MPAGTFPGSVVYSVHYYLQFGVSNLASWNCLVGSLPVWVGEFGSNNQVDVSSFESYAGGKNVSWAWWAINGTKSDAGIFSLDEFYDQESYGILSSSYDAEATAQITSALQCIEGPPAPP